MKTRNQPSYTRARYWAVVAIPFAVLSIMIIVTMHLRAYGDSPLSDDSRIPYTYGYDIYTPYYFYGENNPPPSESYTPVTYDYEISAMYHYEAAPCAYDRYAEFYSLLPCNSLFPLATPAPLGARIYNGCFVCYYEEECAFICNNYANCVNTSALQGTWVETGDGEFFTVIVFSGTRFRAYSYVEMAIIEEAIIFYGERLYDMEIVQFLSSRPWYTWTSFYGEFLGICHWRAPSPDWPSPIILRGENTGIFTIINEGQLGLGFSHRHLRCRPYYLEVFDYWFEDGKLIICNGAEAVAFARSRSL